MPSVRVGVLALQGDVANHLRLLRVCRGVTSAVTVRRVAELDEVDALVVPGGESSVIDKLARTVGLDVAVRQRISDGMPCLGSCAGMILLADRVEGAIEGQQSFGGLDITVRRNAFGRQVDSFEEDLRVAGLDSPFRGVFIRAPWVQQAGSDVQVLARSGEHIVAVRQAGLIATAFHPELGDDARLHQQFVDLAISR